MTTITRASLISGPTHRVTVDAHGANPLAEDYKGVNPDTYNVATSKAGPPPKMFSAGTSDLPAFTASGIDPALLMKLPATARHAAAAEPDLATVHGIFEQSADDPHLVLPHAGLEAAIGRVRDWASGRMDKPEVAS